MPCDGSNSSFREKSKISIRLSQKPGTEANIIASTVQILSIREYCFTAESTPRGIPISTAVKMASTDSFSDIGKALKISSNTGL